MHKHEWVVVTDTDWYPDDVWANCACDDCKAQLKRADIERRLNAVEELPEITANEMADDCDAIPRGTPGIQYHVYLDHAYSLRAYATKLRGSDE